MPDKESLKEAVEDRGPYAVWDLLDDDERRQAAAAAWENAEPETRAPIEAALAKELKFRPRSVRRLPAEKIAGRLAHLAKNLPEAALFPFLFHLHLAARRELLAEFLDDVGLPHDNGVLDLPDDAEAPDAAKVAEAAGRLVEKHGHQALVYLATLKVADGDFWAGVDDVLDRYDESGEALEK